jgi:hypothetical protein
MFGSREDREQLSKAREAAEALFRPKELRTNEPAQATSSSGSSPIMDRPTRVPRVFVVPQANPRDDQPATPTSTPRRASTRKRTKLSPSDHVRIRTLTDYGMTVVQVAEHYGVAVQGIERILAEMPAAQQ